MMFTNHIGRVTSVSTGNVGVSLSGSRSATDISVGGFCAISDQRRASYLIVVVDSVSGVIGETDAAETTATAKMTIIGQLQSVSENEFRFKRGAESFPQLGSECFFLSSTELGSLLETVTASFHKDELFELGRYSQSNTTRVRASGNRFFQRHSAIVGSTGAGKSWAVALLLERASQLPGANIVLFDLHGEYKPLSDSETDNRVDGND